MPIPTPLSATATMRSSAPTAPRLRSRLTSIRIAWHTRTNTRSPLCFAEASSTTSKRGRFSQRGYEDRNLWMAIAERGLPAVDLGPGEAHVPQALSRRAHARSGEARTRETTASCARSIQALRRAPRRTGAAGHASLPEAPLSGRLRWPTAVWFEQHVKRWLDNAGAGRCAADGAGDRRDPLG